MAIVRLSTSETMAASGIKFTPGRLTVRPAVMEQMASSSSNTMTREVHMEPLIYNHTDQEFWNYTDLNRVESWTQYLRDQLNTYGYTAQITSKTWTAGEYPTPTQLARIRSNINALQTAWFAVPEWRELMAVYRPDGRETINAQQVNAQEWDLQQMYDYLKAMVKAFELKQAGTPFMIAGGIYNAG